MPALPYRGRFAPSPTGPLHFGSLLAAFGSWLLARHAGGQWCVRIEDIDPPRAEAGASARQLRTLAAFGLHSDLPVLYQSGRHAQYEAAIATLLEAGLAFECSCSRADLAGMGGIHHACVAPLGARRAVRLRVPPQPPVGFDDALQGHVEQDVHTEVGDVVLRRADGYWAYQLAVVVDDAAQAITDVVRGADLLDSTPRQLLLQRALGLPQPRYLHLPLILDQAGRKLSKSHAAPALDDADPQPALHAAWAVLGQQPDALPRRAALDTLLQHAVQHFSPQQLPRHLHLDANGRASQPRRD
ncbi:tRNA glutamyl-Q(34) synthetase GluQRS [Xanthomonas arboricola pv. juglandis]|uniref:Glutamyl-Q tRNA(Asp) synthetase n=1 Tax=Xanthomonas campestris pv. juglandis TaxID=195709 RepID=A0A2N7V5D0_XANCJ|nr:tRNA glutamyl-Q(34) synthetase GluQRS [Xanthomonas arboricola]AKU48700.1 glutamyl-Q tRNA(Asp) ligase [Xanthomonas arboricola pv. juglandis]KOA99787.1 glutamyl-Q tRNA(Asp) ligase [Xanthomonas arboricola]KOB02623.1 glutamyl-Q tRNA(Asp) ligase [Xanthomonas arboricola]KOB10008.1 glutamyl-Q tRNA(Asp) ligase [Xanthomonas arboricola]KOB12122.1 glutamyl-Q tRNA(Asp) ligase [Xanthomonas arboricola]